MSAKDESSYDDSSSDDDSSLGSDMELEAQRLMDIIQSTNVVSTATPSKAPAQVWSEFIADVEECRTASLKVTDTMVAWVAEKTERLDWTETICNDLVRAVQAGFVLVHVILGRTLLTLLSKEQQERLYNAIIAKHAPTITYWKLGSDDATDTCNSIPTTVLLQSLCSNEWTNLTEMELRGLQLDRASQVDWMRIFIQKAPKIRQFNLLGIVMSHVLLCTEGLFDKLVQNVETVPGFDELQLCREKDIESTASSLPPLISPAALEQLLAVKPKWWRLALDGMGLDDRHLKAIASALQSSKDCKMNDLLSLKHNPNLTAKGLQQLYTVCINKQRMGLVLSDETKWVDTFDLVRPLNNLHRRLDYINENGSGYRSRDAWLDWLVVVKDLPWIGDARKVNYLWFALLEQPELIYA